MPLDATESKTLLNVEGLTTYFDITGGLLGNTTARVHAVEDISFHIKPGETFEEGQVNLPLRAVALLRDDQFHGDGIWFWPATVLVVLPGVRVGTIQQRHEISILLDGPRLTQVRKPRLAVAFLLDFAIQLAQHDDRHIQLLGQGLDAARDVSNLLLPVLGSSSCGMKELQVVHD